MAQMKVDEKVYELVKHFLSGIKGVKGEDITECAEQIQLICEDWARTCSGEYDNE